MPELRRIDGAEGVVKWFDPRKGYGFIVGPEGQDIFTHYTVIVGDGFRVLRDGAKVRYSAHETERGWKACSVENLSPEGLAVTVVPQSSQTTYARSPRR